MNQPSLNSGSISLVAAMDQPEVWSVFPNTIEAARELAPTFKIKVAVAIVDQATHIALGFPSDSTIEIADAAFTASIGQGWRQRAQEIGGGELLLDFANNTVTIQSYAPSMNNLAVPRSAEAAVIQAVRGMMSK